MEVRVTHNERNRDMVISHSVSTEDLLNNTLPKILEQIHKQVAHEIAEECVSKYLPQIMEKISPEAIANMSIAEAGAMINETLHKKLPDKVLTVEKTKEKIFQKGIFGGMKRIA